MTDRQLNRQFSTAVLAFTVVVGSVWPSTVLSADLQSATFVPDLSVFPLSDVSPAELTEAEMDPLFVYSVLCERRDQCRMRLELSSDAVEAPLRRSESLRQDVETTLRGVKERGYPQSHDSEYEVLEGMRPVDCWSSGDPGQGGSLCRFDALDGRVKWVVLWGEMCSSSCYSGFVPLFVVPNK
jgi:hypothetical protein